MSPVISRARGYAARPHARVISASIRITLTPAPLARSRSTNRRRVPSHCRKTQTTVVRRDEVRADLRRDDLQRFGGRSFDTGQDVENLVKIGQLTPGG